LPASYRFLRFSFNGYTHDRFLLIPRTGIAKLNAVITGVCHGHKLILNTW
jgi:hypothetical protein